MKHQSGIKLITYSGREGLLSLQSPAIRSPWAFLLSRQKAYQKAFSNTGTQLSEDTLNSGHLAIEDSAYCPSDIEMDTKLPLK